MIKIVFLGLNDTGSKVLKYLTSLNEDKIYLITDKNGLQDVPGIKPDIILSVGFRSIIPREILSVPPLGAINFHKSLLPLNRGANPVFWTILNNTKAGVTIHYMDEGIDTGNIIAQKELYPDLRDTAETLYGKLEKLQLELFKEVWQKIRTGNVKVTVQRGDPSYHIINDFKKLRKINENETVVIHDFIDYLRAMTFPPFNNSYIERDGKKYFLEVSICCEDDMPDKKGGSTILKQYKIDDVKK